MRDVRTISRLSRSASWVFQRNFINHQKPTNFRATWLRYNPMTVTLTSYPYFLSYVYAFLLYPSSSILLCLPFFCSYVYPYSSYAYFVPLLVPSVVFPILFLSYHCHRHLTRLLSMCLVLICILSLCVPHCKYQCVGISSCAFTCVRVSASLSI